MRWKEECMFKSGQQQRELRILCHLSSNNRHKYIDKNERFLTKNINWSQITYTLHD